MNLESLQAGLEAINALSISDEDKNEMAAALTAQFGETVNVTDDEATDAMPAAMRARLKASDCPAEERAGILENAREIVRSVKLSTIRANVGKASKDAPAGAADVETIVSRVVAKLQTNNYAGFGARPAAPAPARGNKDKDKTQAVPVKRFVAKLQSLSDGGLSSAQAIGVARSKDSEGYNSWCAAGRPTAEAEKE